MDPDEPFDIEAYAPDPRSTTTATRRANRKPVRRAYGRRGSLVQLSRHSSLPPYLEENDGNGFSYSYDDNNNDDRLSSDGGGLFGTSTPSGKPDWLLGERIESPLDATPASTSSSAGRRRFIRSHSITGATSTTSPDVPKLPPLLKRSFSVSTALCPNPNQFGSSSSHRSSSLSSGLSSMDNNFDLFKSTNDENLHMDSTSPKRAAESDDETLDHTDSSGNNVKDPRGRTRRKKTRSGPRSFLNNDFSSLFDDQPTSDGLYDYAKTNNSSSFLGSNKSSFSNLARHGRTGSGWASLSQSEEDVAENGCPAFSSPGTSSSSRKRSSQESPSTDNDDGTPPKSRSRSRVTSTPEHFANESPFPNGLMSVESRRSRSEDYGMDMSFLSPPTGENDRTAPVLDVSMTDDEVNMTADDSGDDNTVVPEDPFPAQPTAARSDDRDNGGAQRLDLEKAGVDDIIDSMSSYHDLRFLARSLREDFQRKFTMGTINVSLQTDWGTERREKFLQWTLKALGFKLFNAGNKVHYVQISKGRGNVLLELLNNASRVCRERGLGGAPPPTAAKEVNTSTTFLFSPSKMARRPTYPMGSRSDTLPRSLNLDTPKESVAMSPWLRSSGDSQADDLAQQMQSLSMNQSSKKNKPNEKHFSNQRLSISSEASDFSISRFSRPSLEHGTSNAALMAHLHGSSTPVPRSRTGRPPRASLQSVASSTGPPIAALKINTCPSPLYGISSIGGGDFTLTPCSEPLDAWGSQPKDGRDWGTSEALKSSIVDELLQRLIESRRKDGLSECDEDDEEGVGEPQTKYPTLDLSGVGDYRNGPESPSSATSQDLEEADDDQQSMILSQESLDFFSNNQNARLETYTENTSRDARRRYASMAKHRRMSMFAAAASNTESFFRNRKSLFIRPSLSTRTPKPAFVLESQPEFCRHTWSPKSSKSQDGQNVTSETPFDDPDILRRIFSFLPPTFMVTTAGLVSKKWLDASAYAYADLLRRSVGCDDIGNGSEDLDDDQSIVEEITECRPDQVSPMDRPWQYLMSTFPWACFLGEGAFKRVYKVFNRSLRVEEAVSVMDLDIIKSTGNMSTVGTELGVSVLLSSLVRVGVCPNFVVTRSAFTSHFEPPAHYWGDANNKKPKGDEYISPAMKRKQPKEPKQRGRFQYIRQELCDEGDAEEYLKRQPNESILPDRARQLLFQITFAIHAAADRFSLKHYDIKLLNIFLKRAQTDKSGDVILRYGLGEHTFAIRQHRDEAIIAKLADFGTASVDSGLNGQQVTIAQFTTFENTPPDFLLLGDKAQQGHGHDNFGLGLCMLHLMTGHAPYEEIMEDVHCPDNLKRELRKVWENEEEAEFSVLRSVVLADCFMDDEGHILEGEPDEVLYDTLYKFLVLFGIPDDALFSHSKTMKAIKATLTSESKRNLSKKGRGAKRMTNDATAFYRDRRRYSIHHGNNPFIARARENLMSMDGGMELLLALVDFNPNERATALDVLNSDFMAPLREIDLDSYSLDDDVRSYAAFATH